MDTATLFSSLDNAPYDTVTAPTEEAASGTGNDQGPSGAPSGAQAEQPPSGYADEMPMSKIMAAVMRGAGRVQGQEQAKQTVAKQAANSDKIKVTMEPNPNDPGNPLLTIKNVTADKLNGTEAADVQRAYTQPSQQVEAKLAGGGQQQTAAPQQQGAPTPATSATATAAAAPPPNAAPPHPTDIVDQTLGFHLPRGADSDIAEKLKTPDGIRQLNYELGGNERHAQITIKALKEGRITPEEVQQRVALFREKRYAQVHEEIQAPIDAAQRIADRQWAEQDRQLNQQRLLRSQSDAELAAGNKEKLDWLKQTDLSTIDPGQLEATAQASTNAAWTPQDLNRARLKQQQDVNKAFLDYTDTKKDTFALGSQPTWEAAKAAFGHPLTPQQDTIGRARWQAAHNYALKQQDKEARAAERENDLHQRTVQLLSNATKDKPVALNDSFVKNSSADDLIGSIDGAKNPDLVLQKKATFLKDEISDRTSKHDAAVVKANSITATPENKRRWGWETPLATANLEAQQHAARIMQATQELQQVQAALAARRGVRPPAAPAVPPSVALSAATSSGATGSAAPAAAPPAAQRPAAAVVPPPVAAPRQSAPPPAAPIANGRYAPQIENGIAAYMQTHGIGRSKAIQALRAAGKIQ